jgi:SRSO17 transposase
VPAIDSDQCVAHKTAHQSITSRQTTSQPGETIRNTDYAEALIFAAAPARGHARSYMRGLLSPLARKNGWTIAEYVGEDEPKGLQRFLNIGRWNTDKLLGFNRDYAMEHFASTDAILVADPTGFAKKGKMSVGVQRQYSGTLGRIDNCQIATFLAYVTPGRDRVLIDRRLYMPHDSWIADPQRCAQAGCPPELTFKTRPQQVQDMIEAAFDAEVPFAWFTADEEFGQNSGLCDYLEGKLARAAKVFPVQD